MKNSMHCMAATRWVTRPQSWTAERTPDLWNWLRSGLEIFACFAGVVLMASYGTGQWSLLCRDLYCAQWLDKAT